MLLPDEAKVKTQQAKFNIYAYNEDPGFLTSVAEGDAEMDAGLIYKVPLRPGQAASYWRLKELTLDSAVDLKWVLAWKNGLFVFDHEMISYALQQIERWYDARIIDDTGGRYDTTCLIGTIPRTAPVQEVLELIERQSHLRFTIHENIITVTKSDSTSRK